jgi:hypothetical protein
MAKVLAVRLPSGLLAKAVARANQLGLDQARYVRRLIEQDLARANLRALHRFASEDLVGAFRLGGKSATNQRVCATLRKHAEKRSTSR